MRQLWSILVVGGFFAWVGSIFFIIFYGMDAKGRFKSKTTLLGLVVLVLGYIFWIVGLIKAP